MNKRYVLALSVPVVIPRSDTYPGLLAQPGVELVSVANRSVESSQRVATTFAIPKVANHWQEIVADDGVDAVCIGTWHVYA